MSILLPTSFTLNQVSKLDSLVRFRNGRQYSKQEIKKIITNHEPLKNLIKAFKEQVQFEFESLQFDSQTRIFFYKAFKKLQKQNQDLIPSLKTKISNLEKNPQLTEEDAKKLKRLKKEYLFLTEGRMGETIRLFAKIILPFNALDNQGLLIKIS